METGDFKIEPTTMGSLSVGEFITNVDNDELTTTEAIMESYITEDQDWHRVVHIGGHADVGTVTLAMYNGETYTSRCSWEQTTWRLVRPDGTPQRQDED